MGSKCFVFFFIILKGSSRRVKNWSQEMLVVVGLPTHQPMKVGRVNGRSCEGGDDRWGHHRHRMHHGPRGGQNAKLL